jgi:hypothetical protein
MSPSAVSGNSSRFWDAPEQLTPSPRSGVAEVGDRIDIAAQLIRQLHGFEPLRLCRPAQWSGALTFPGAKTGSRHERRHFLDGPDQGIGAVGGEQTHQRDIAVSRREIEGRGADITEVIPADGDIGRLLGFPVVTIESHFLPCDPHVWLQPLRQQELGEVERVQIAGRRQAP